jgi:hypothetical protein
MTNMPRPGTKDKKLYFLITGEELTELQNQSWKMTEAFGLDRRIENYQGKRPLGLYSWDLECLLCVMEDTLKDNRNYPDRNASGFQALERLFKRVQDEYRNNFG